MDFDGDLGNDRMKELSVETNESQIERKKKFANSTVIKVDLTLFRRVVIFQFVVIICVVMWFVKISAHGDLWCGMILAAGVVARK